MSNDVDELFGEGGGNPQPRTTTIVLMLSIGLMVALLGMACTAVPGGVIVLMAWMLAEKEVDRIENGYLADDTRLTVNRLQLISLISVVFVVVLFAVQAWLFCSGYYDLLWAGALGLITSYL